MTVIEGGNLQNYMASAQKKQPWFAYKYFADFDALSNLSFTFLQLFFLADEAMANPFELIRVWPRKIWPSFAYLLLTALMSGKTVCVCFEFGFKNQTGPSLSLWGSLLAIWCGITVFYHVDQDVLMPFKTRKIQNLRSSLSLYGPIPWDKAFTIARLSPLCQLNNKIDSGVQVISDLVWLPSVAVTILSAALTQVCTTLQFQQLSACWNVPFAQGLRIL